METTLQKNIPIQNPSGKIFLADAVFPEQNGKYPLVVFIHGYKGYKDWGA